MVQKDLTDAKRRIGELEKELASLAPGFPRIAQGADIWGSEVCFVHGMIERRWNYSGLVSITYIEQRILPNGTVGTRRHGCSIGDNPRWWPAADEIALAQKFPKAKWAKAILAKHAALIPAETKPEA